MHHAFHISSHCFVCRFPRLGSPKTTKSKAAMRSLTHSDLRSMKQAVLGFKRKASPEIVSLISDEEGGQPKSTPNKKAKQSSPESQSDVPAAGPSNSFPLSIVPPPFDLSTGFSEIEPRVIKKDPGLDLLYFSPQAFLSASIRKQLFEYLRKDFPWVRLASSRPTTNSSDS